MQSRKKMEVTTAWWTNSTVGQFLTLLHTPTQMVNPSQLIRPSGGHGLSSFWASVFQWRFDATKAPLFDEHGWRLHKPQVRSAAYCSIFHPNAHNSDHGSITLRFNSHSVSMCMVKPGGHFESQGPTWPASAFVARLSRPPRSAVRAPRSSQLSVSKDVKGCEGLRKLRPR